MSEMTDSAEALIARMYEHLAYLNAVEKGRKIHMDDPNATDPRRARITKQIAEFLIDAYGPAAHFHALKELEAETMSRDMWRDVLSWMDDLTKEGERNEPEL
jgi:hypothetical protein